MSTERAAIRIDGSGDRPTVTKRAASPVVAERLRHEAAMLERVQIPGVISLVEYSDDDPPTLRTRFGGSRTLAATPQMDLPRCAGLVAALASTVADLHGRGVAHRRLTADHVLVAPDGRPVICGFGGASTEPTQQIDDVRSLGMLLTELVRPLADEAPIPAQRLGRRSGWSGYQRRALLNLADQAASEHSTLTAAALARSILATAPDATLTDASESDAPSPTRRRFEHRLARAAAIAAAVLVAVGGVIAMLGSDDAGREDAGGAVLPASAAPTSTTTTSADTTEPPAPPADEPEEPDEPAVAEGPGERAVADHPALGCGANSEEDSTTAAGRDCDVTVSVRHGILTVDDLQFEVGADPAAVAIGDFRCVGAADPALLDVETGEVFLFDDWADRRSDVTATAVQQIEGARRLLAEPVGPRGCHRLVVLDRFGLRHVIPTEEHPS